MTSTYHSQYPLLHIDLNEDQDQLVPFSPKPAEFSSSSSSSSFSPNLVSFYPIFINPNQDGGSYYYQGSNPFRNQEEANKNISLGGSCENPTLLKHGRIKLPISKKKDGLNGNRVADEGTNSSKWISSKTKLMKKMVRSDQAICIVPETSIKRVAEDHKNRGTSSFQTDKDDKNNTNNTSVRVCSDCYTTKTPLWRSGPRGPKSLCNACGIRQRKARRAMAAAAAAEAAGANGSDSAVQNITPITLKTRVQKKVKKGGDSHLPFKKRCKFASQDRCRKKLCFEELSIILSKKYSTFQQVFPQDEKEAAILLMALSYGLVHG